MEQYDVLAVMGRRLRETGLYKVDGTTLVDAELAAYAAGLEPVFAAYAILQRELCIATAETFGLTLREALAGQYFGHLPTEERRRMLLERFAIGPDDYTVPALERALDSIGIGAQITENTAAETITVAVTDVSRLRAPTADSVQALAAQFLPAHLLVVYDFSQAPSLAQQ